MKSPWVAGGACGVSGAHSLFASRTKGMAPDRVPPLWLFLRLFLKIRGGYLAARDRVEKGAAASGLARPGAISRELGPGAGEYKDIQLNMEVEFAGVTHIVEVQLALRLMQEIKRPRHKLYKWLRLEKVEDLSAQYVFTEAPPLRPEEVAQRRLSRRKGRAAQGSASTASSRCDSEVGDSGRAAVGAAITAAGAAEDACAVPASRSAGLGSAVTADAALIGTQLQPGLAQPLALAEELGAHVPAMGASMTGRQPRSVAGPQALAIAELEYCASLTSAVKAQGEALAEVSKSFRHASHASPEQRGELLRIQQDLVRQSSQLLRAHSQRPQSGAFGRDRLHHGREDA